MKIIIVGCGKVGITIIEQLVKEKHDITVIDLKADIVNSVSSNYDVQGVIGNAVSLDIQKEAGASEADLLIAVTHSDELNLMCCLIAKSLGHINTIARVRNPIYGQESNILKENLGLSMIINPEYAAAAEIARLLRFPSAIQIETFAKGRVEIMKFKVTEHSPLEGYSLKDIPVKLHCNVLICAIERGDRVIIPSGDDTIQNGDKISIVGTAKDTTAFFKKIGIDTNQVKNAVIVGAGETAFYLSDMLLKRGIKVKIIEKNKDRCEELSELLPSAMIINGDGTDKQLLYEEGIKKCEAFVSLTNIDEENVLLTLYAKSQTKGKLVTKVNSISFNEIINNLNLDSIIYPKHITADYILQYARAMNNSIGSNVETLYKLCDEKVEALEFHINGASNITGVPLQDLELLDDLLVCCINHKGNIIIPRGQDIINEDDTVIVVTTKTGLHDIKDILK